MTEHSKKLLVFGLAVVWTLGWGIRAGVEVSNGRFGWAVYCVLMFTGGVAWAASRLRQLRAPAVEDRSESWFGSWQRWHVVLMVAGSLVATAGMFVLADEGAWVLVPVLGLCVLLLFTPLGRPPKRTVPTRRAATAARRDGERRRRGA